MTPHGLSRVCGFKACAPGDQSHARSCVVRGLGLGFWLLQTLACAPSADLGRWDDPKTGPAGAAAVSGMVDAAARAALNPVPDAMPAMPVMTASPDGGSAAPDVCPQLRPLAARCSFGTGARLPADLAGDPHGSIRLFANGAELPKGRYRIAYIDGCIRYVSSVLPEASDSTGYTVHATVADPITGAGAYWLYAADLTRIVMTPGTIGTQTGAGDEPFGAFATYAQCVEANCALSAREFSFEGGSLGLSKGVLPPSESVIDPPRDQHAPTFRLSYLDDCPESSASP